ncbi:MAG: alpha-ribazole phosphatase family protein [Gammaproteobacteria bacterium]
MSDVITTVDLIRHGEPVGGRKYRGQLDDPLSDKGWRQMRRAVAGDVPWDLVLSSPLRRCLEFARELSQRRALALEIEERFKEVGFGAWEGRTAEQVAAHDPDVLRRFWRDPMSERPPGAEPLPAFRGRVVSAWNDMLRRHAGRHVLIVGHAGVIRMVLSHVLGMPPAHLFRIQVQNAGITRIEVQGEGEAALPRLMFHGGMSRGKGKE